MDKKEIHIIYMDSDTTIDFTGKIVTDDLKSIFSTIRKLVKERGNEYETKTDESKRT